MSPEFGLRESEDEPPSMSNLHPDHIFQKPGSGWCGPTALQMGWVLAGKDRSQDEIANTIMKDGKSLFDKDWGTSHERMAEYIEKHFFDYGIQSNTSFDRINELLSQGYFIIANVQGLDIEDNGEIDKGGHYVVIRDYDKTKNLVTIFDPSNGKRPDGKYGVYTIRAEVDPSEPVDSIGNKYCFENYFWDYANPSDEKNHTPTHNWIAYFNPLSVKEELAREKVA